MMSIFHTIKKTLSFRKRKASESIKATWPKIEIPVEIADETIHKNTIQHDNPQEIVEKNSENTETSISIELPSDDQPTHQEKSNHGTSLQMADDKNQWFLVGASVTGNGHKITNTPCQDAHKIELWENGWGIAVVSDGAGSAGKSHFSSAFLTEEAVKQSLELVRRKGWMENDSLPGRDEWDKEARELLNNLQDSLINYAKEIETHFYDLHATLIMIIFSTKGILVVHIGDGRAGYLSESGELSALITPFEGEQAGETVFITLDMKKFEHIVESTVINEPVKAFFLLTDGCEKVCWETLARDPETKNFFKPNKPFEKFFSHTFEAFRSIQENQKTEEIAEKWYNYLDNGHKGFQKETDDKTMIIAMNDRL